MKVLVSGMGTVSVLGKTLAEHRQALFYNVKNEQNQLAPYAPSPDNLAKTPPDLRMLPLDREKNYFEKLLSRQLSRNSAMALMAFEEAFGDSGLQANDLSHKKIAVFMGTTAGCAGTDTKYIEDFVMDRSPDPQFFKLSLKQNPAAILKDYLLLKGVSAEISIFLINNACTSSTDALGLATKLLKQGRYDFVFAGGADEILFQTYYGFASLQLVSKIFSSQPFDKNRDGLLLTEGAAVLCLESEESYLLRKTKNLAQNVMQNTAWGEVLGYESVSEVYHQTSPNPEADGLKKICSDLLEKAALLSTDLDFVNAHATGTPTNDLSEGRFFAQHFPNTRVFATKGYTGHCLGAVGALEAAFCFLCMKEKKLPPSVGFSEVDPAIGLRPTTEHTRLEAKQLIALSTSVGFGGVNSALLLRGVSK